MATYLLDTSVIIDAINEKKGRRQLLRELLEQATRWLAAPSTLLKCVSVLERLVQHVTVLRCDTDLDVKLPATGTQMPDQWQSFDGRRTSAQDNKNPFQISPFSVLQTAPGTTRKEALGHILLIAASPALSDRGCGRCVYSAASRVPGASIWTSVTLFCR